MREEQSGCRVRGGGEAQTPRGIERDAIEDAETKRYLSRLQTFLERRQGFRLARRLDDHHPGGIEPQRQKTVPRGMAELTRERTRPAPQQ